MIWLIIATLCAFFVKGLCGFANTLVFTSILGFTTDNINISPVEVILGYPSNVILVCKERKSLDWKVWLPVSLMVLAGSVPGIFLLKNVDATIIKIIFGFVVIVIGIEMLLRERRASDKEPSKGVLLVIGILSGLLCGLYGVGALLAAYISRVTKTSSGFRGNISLVFMIENTLRIILYTATGIVTLGVIKQVIVLIPFMLIGVFVGIGSGAVLDEKTVKKIVVIMLIISGIALIMNSLV